MHDANTTTTNKLHSWLYGTDRYTQQKARDAHEAIADAKAKGYLQKHSPRYGRVHEVAYILIAERDRASEMGDTARAERFDALADDWIRNEVFQFKGK